MSRKNNVLKQAEQFKQYDWIKANKEVVQTSTAAELALLASAALNIPLTEANMRAARESAGLRPIKASDKAITPAQRVIAEELCRLFNLTGAGSPSNELMIIALGGQTSIF